METEEMHTSDVPVEGPLRYVATEVHNVMADFEDLACHVVMCDTHRYFEISILLRCIAIRYCILSVSIFCASASS